MAMKLATKMAMASAPLPFPLSVRHNVRVIPGRLVPPGVLVAEPVPGEVCPEVRAVHAPALDGRAVVGPERIHDGVEGRLVQPPAPLRHDLPGLLLGSARPAAPVAVDHVRRPFPGGLHVRNTRAELQPRIAVYYDASMQ